MNYVEVTGGLKSQRDVVGKTVGWFIRNHMKRFRTLDIQIVKNKVSKVVVCTLMVMSSNWR
jgi:hypothetical protein